jgi:hypothetical protein
VSAESLRLPPVQDWTPRRDKTAVLQDAYRRRCQDIERTIVLRATQERGWNLDNFDSGGGVEEILRDELGRLLPKRYDVGAGIVSDAYGYTAGDCDLVVYNGTWFPALKAPAADAGRRTYYPVDGLYAVAEIKQTLSPATLDQAMQKLVTCHRLHRRPVEYDRVVENKTGGSCTHYVSNPLFSVIFAGRLAAGWSMDDAVERFVRINQLLERKAVVRSLCVLGQGAAWWGFREGREVKSAMFRSEDLYEPLLPVYSPASIHDSALYPTMVNLMTSLYLCVLGPEDVAAYYGPGEPGYKAQVKSSTSRSDWLPQDATLMRKLRDKCTHPRTD